MHLSLSSQMRALQAKRTHVYVSCCPLASALKLIKLMPCLSSITALQVIQESHGSATCKSWLVIQTVWLCAGYTVMHHAVAGGNLEIVNTLLRTGHATPDGDASRNRITPLHVAAKHGRLVLLPILMQAGYKAQALTSDGK